MLIPFIVIIETISNLIRPGTECEILCYQLCCNMRCIAVLNNATECISKCSDTYLQNITFRHGHERRCIVV